MEIEQELTKSKINIKTKVFNMPSYLHWHNNYEICRVLKNKCIFLINGQYVEASEGDFVIIEENIVHRFVVHEYTEVKIIQFSIKVLLESGITMKKLKTHITAEEIHRISGFEDKMNMLISMIEGEGCTRVGCNNSFHECLVSALYSLFVNHFEDMGAAVISREQKDFLQIVYYIAEHFTENINVNILSERLHMNRKKLSEIFKKYSGMSVNEYIHSIRIKRVNELIKQGNDITEAALQSGFQNVRTFNNIYKKVVGITPTKFKMGGELIE